MPFPIASPRRFAALPLLPVLAFAILALPASGPTAPVEHFADAARMHILSPEPASDFARPLIAGDFNGDGLDDIVVGQSSAPNFANAYVIRGERRNPGPWPRVVDLAAAPASKRLFGANQGINLPTALAVGDLNGDGYDDLALTAPLVSPLGRTNAGVVYVVLGGPNFFADPTDLSLAAPQNAAVVTFQGATAGGDLGSQSVFGGMDAYGLAIGDLNGDGIDDLVVGAHLASPSGRGQAGQVYIFFGRSNLAGGQTYDLANADVRIDGARQYYETGTRLAVGDITGDGIDDLVIACDTAGEQTFFLSMEGIAYVLRGRTQWNSTYDLRTITPDLKILGRRDGDGLGSSLALVDMNRDGILDLCLGATGGGSTPMQDDNYGSVAVFFGGAALGTLPRTINLATVSPSIEWTGPAAYSNMGWAMTTGDFDGDGHESLAVSAVFANYGEQSTNGFVEVLDSRSSWPTGALIRSALGQHDRRIVGPPQGRYGFWLTAADANGDGIDEVVVGAPFHGDGEVHVHQLVIPLAASERSWTMYE